MKIKGNIKYFLLILLIFQFSCVPKIKITDNIMYNYINAYEKIQNTFPSHIKILRDEKVDSEDEENMDDFEKVEEIVKLSGFSSYAEFAKVNAAVIWAFSHIESKKFINEMLIKSKEGITLIDKQLNAPNTSQEKKNKLKAEKEKLFNYFNKNRPWSELIIEGTNKLADEDSVNVVRKHSEALELVFQEKYKKKKKWN